MKKRVKEQQSENKAKPSKVQANSFGASGFTLGILSLISLGLFGVITSIVGFIFCFIQQKNKKTKLGKAGMIVNAIAFVLSLLWIFVIAPMLSGLIQKAGNGLY
jgi:multisubunit Na+/H+ antiporter MnhG subunit